MNLSKVTKSNIQPFFITFSNLILREKRYQIYLYLNKTDKIQIVLNACK